MKELVQLVISWLQYLASKWKIIIISGLLGIVVGLLYSFFKPPLFTATTTFVLETGDGSGGLSKYAGVAAMAGIDLGGSTSGLFQGDNILELYRSRRMLAETLMLKTYPDSAERLIERYIDFNELRQEWKDKPHLLALDFKKHADNLHPDTLRLREGVISSIANKINSEILVVDKVDKNLSIIKVEVTSEDEVFSKAFNETLVQQVNNFYIQTRTKKSAASLTILQHKVDSVRAVLNNAIFSLARISDVTHNLNPTRQVQRAAPIHEAQFSAESNKVMLTQLLQNLEITKMNLMQEQPLIQLVDQPVYPLNVSVVGKTKGAVVGFILFILFVVIFLMAKKWYHDTMSAN